MYTSYLFSLSTIFFLTLFDSENDRDGRGRVIEEKYKRINKIQNSRYYFCFIFIFYFLSNNSNYI